MDGLCLGALARHCSPSWACFPQHLLQHMPAAADAEEAADVAVAAGQRRWQLLLVVAARVPVKSHSVCHQASTLEVQCSPMAL